MKFKFIIVFIYLLSNIFVFFLFNKINSDGIIIKYVKLDQFYGLFFDKSHQKFQSFPHLKLSFSKPIDKKDNSIHTDEANIKKYFRYGANYNFDLKKYSGTVTCIDTNKVFLLTISASEKKKGGGQDILNKKFHYSKNYYKFYRSNRAFKQNNCYEILPDTILIVNFDVYSPNNFLKINNDKYFEKFDYESKLYLYILFFLVFFPSALYFRIKFD